MLNIVENIMSLKFLLSLKTTPSPGVGRKYIKLSGLEEYGQYLSFLVICTLRGGFVNFFKKRVEGD